MIKLRSIEGIVEKTLELNHFGSEDLEWDENVGRKAVEMMMVKVLDSESKGPECFYVLGLAHGSLLIREAITADQIDEIMYEH